MFLCDYCCRENITFPARPAIRETEKHDPGAGILIGAGQLHQHHRKRHLRINGFHDTRVFEENRADALRLFVWHLAAYAREFTHADLLTILNRCWNEIVAAKEAVA